MSEPALPPEDEPSAREQYYRNAPVGSTAVVRQTYGGMIEFRVAKIEGRNPRAGRVYIAGEGAFFMKSGKNCFEPTGQKHLALLTPEVEAWVSRYPTWELLWDKRGRS